MALSNLLIVIVTEYGETRIFIRGHMETKNFINAAGNMWELWNWGAKEYSLRR